MVADVLLAHHAGVDQAKPRNGHHQNQGHRGEHPSGIAGIGRAILEDGQLRIGIAGAKARSDCGDDRRIACYLLKSRITRSMPLTTRATFSASTLSGVSLEWW